MAKCNIVSVSEAPGWCCFPPRCSCHVVATVQCAHASPCMCTCMCTDKRQNWKVPNKVGAFIEALWVDNPRDTGSSETESLTQRNKGVRVLKKERGNLPKLFGLKCDWCGVGPVALILMQFFARASVRRKVPL